MYLIFDTETTGFPKKDFKDESNPRIIQIAWSLHDIDGRCINSFHSLIKPDNWEVPSIDLYIREGKTMDEAIEKSKFWVEKGFTQSKNLREGLEIELIFPLLIESIKKCNLLIAHNITFDLSILKSELFKYGVEMDLPNQFCTMKETTDICQLPGRYSFKWPSLTELHKFLFNEDFIGAHDALSDVNATTKCLFELKKQNLINI